MIRSTHRAFATTFTFGSLALYNTTIDITKNHKPKIEFFKHIVDKISEYPQVTLTTMVIATIVAWVIASVPDIDNLLERYHIPNPIFKHRGITHTIWIILLFVYLTYITTNWILHAIMLGVTLGWLSHLVADAFSVSGILWFYPFQQYGTYHRRTFFIPLYRVGNQVGPIEGKYYYYALTIIIVVAYTIGW